MTPAESSQSSGTKGQWLPPVLSPNAWPPNQAPLLLQQVPPGVLGIARQHRRQGLGVAVLRGHDQTRRPPRPVDAARRPGCHTLAVSHTKDTTHSLSSP